MDINGATVRGVVACKGCRAVWHEGTLYVVRSLTDVIALDCPTEPRRNGGGYQATLPHSIVTIQKPGCNCKKKPELGALTLEQIIGMVPQDEVIDAVVDPQNPEAFKSVGEALSSL